MKKYNLLEKLGLYGWNKIEPVLLASLASEYPLLLIGKHGCAKSFILEKLSKELKMEYRFYNSSLLNYDDLVGIPIPNSDYTALKYISNSESIWDSEIVFIDEINRCKEDLQNKLFPIIYDKRIQGVSLDKLKYRWAAMNPPEELDEDYTGAINLDKALADRFPFIIKVPEYSELKDNEIEEMLLDSTKGEHYLDIDLKELINEIKDEYKVVKKEVDKEAVKYIMCLSKLLINKYKYISSRRATMLYNTLLYTYAALKVIDSKSTFEDAIYSHILYSLPYRCSENIDDSMLINIASEAIAISKVNDNKDLYLMNDGCDKLIKLIKFYSDIDEKELNEIVCSSISSIKDDKQKRIMALFSYMKLRENKKIYASTIETLYLLSQVFYNTESYSELVHLSEKKIKNKVEAILSNEVDEEYYVTLNNVLNYFSTSFADSFTSVDEVVETTNFFKEKYGELFNVSI